MTIKASTSCLVNGVTVNSDGSRQTTTVLPVVPKRAQSAVLYIAQTPNALSFTSIPRYDDEQDTVNAEEDSTNRNKTQVDILWSYVYNLQRIRREYSSNHPNKLNDKDKKRMKEPIISLLYFLQEQHYSALIDHTGTHVLLVEPLQRALIQSMRIASSFLADYRLIIQLVDGAIQFATHRKHMSPNTTTTTTAAAVELSILNPRIMGEAITELYRCRANMNKIRSTWSLLLMQENHHIWTRSIGAHEINSMLQIYVQECKVNAALDLYHQYVNITDAYSVSLLLQVLQASVSKAKSSTIVNGQGGQALVTHSANASTTVKTTTSTSAMYAERYRTVSESELHCKELVPLLQMSYSNNVWWQWNIAVYILDEALSRATTLTTMEGNHYRNDQSNVMWHNNPIWTNLLQLNGACSSCNDISTLQGRGQYHHDGSMIVKSLLRIMEQRNIQPDAITSTLLLSNLRSHPSDCELAVSLLRNAGATDNLTSDSNNLSRQKKQQWALAKPNVYMYSAVMTLCARQRQYQLAIHLLNEYEQSQLLPKRLDNDQATSAPSKLYLFNSALQALTPSPNYQRGRISPKVTRKHKKSKTEKTKERIKLAFQLYHRMTKSHRSSPDVVTYNTILAILGGDRSIGEQLEESDWKEVYENQFNDDLNLHLALNNNLSGDAKIYSHLEHLVNALLERMIHCKIDHNTMTYKYAIRAMMSMPQTDSKNDYCTTAVLRIVRRAQMQQKRYKRRIIEMQEIHNEAFYAFADSGNVIGTVRMMAMLYGEGLVLESDHQNDMWLHVINAIGNGHMTRALPAVLAGQVQPDTDLYTLSNGLGLDWTKLVLPLFNTSHFSAAITCCLKESDFESARHVLTRMRELGLRPTSKTLHDISKSYAKIALEYKDTSLNAKLAPSMEHPSVIRARSSFTILSSIDNPSHSLVAIVSRACCSAGMFKEAQTLLRTLHKRVLQLRWEEYEASRLGTSDPQFEILLNDIFRILSPLHQDLLRYCANQGNVTNALSLCEDIQYISRQCMIKTKSQDQRDAHNVTATIHEFVPIDSSNSVMHPAIGMTMSGWKSLLIAAAKSGHWRVCLSTLQFLRPYLEATRPSNDISKQEQAHRNMLYGQLETAINVAVKCLAIRSQYGWIVRVMDDWIEWSGGRRPPLSAVLSAIRALSTRGRGEEVNNLLTRCINTPVSNLKYDDKVYKAMLFVGSITALYNEGLYDEADDAFVCAITRYSLPLNIRHEIISGTERRTTLDLHGMNQAVAHSAVRIALQQLAISVDHWNRDNHDASLETDMVIITGRGLNSAIKMRPVLRPVVQRMLVEEFYPPLSSTSVPGNMGAIVISPSDITHFLDHQRQQKGARLLLVAAMLKNIVAPGGRLSIALAQLNKGTE